MKRYRKYCDICKRRIISHNKVKTNILQKLKLISVIYTLYTIFPNIDESLGDVCNDCLISFKKWIKIRKCK